MLSGKSISLDYIIEQLYDEYKFTDVDKASVAELVWKAVGIIGTLEPLSDVTPKGINIENHRGELPYDFYELTGVREYTTGTMMTEVTDLYYLSTNTELSTEEEVIADTDPATGEEFYTVVFSDSTPELYRYKLQGNYIYTAFSTGRVEIAYKAFPVDIETGMPILPDDAKYLRGVVSFIAERLAFGMLMQDLISERKYELINQQYLFNIGSARNRCIMPNSARLEVLANRWKSPHPYHEHHATGFKYIGSRRNY